MSENLTDKLPKTDSEKLNLILSTTQNLEQRFEKLEDRVQNFETRVYGIDSRLEGFEKIVEQKLHDTRPIWHKVVGDIAQLQVGQDAMREQIRELYSTVRDVNRDQIVMNDVLRRVQMDIHKIDVRIHSLELDHNHRNSST
jgi:hypothetical protein